MKPLNLSQRKKESGFQTKKMTCRCRTSQKVGLPKNIFQKQCLGYHKNDKTEISMIQDFHPSQQSSAFKALCPFIP